MDLPTEVWLIVKPEDRYWRSWRSRIYHRWATVRQVLSWHKGVKLYKATVTWEEVDVG